MGAKGSVEAAKLNADGWGHLEVRIFEASHKKLGILVALTM